MTENKTIKKIDKDHIGVITTTTTELLISKATLEAQKAAKEKEIEEIDDLLKNF